MKSTVICFIAIIACTSAASVAGKVELRPEAQDIVDAAKPLTDEKKIAKMIRIIASQGPNSRALIANLNNVSSAAQMCALSQAQVVGHKVQSKQITPESATQTILTNCSPYKDQLEPVMTAFQGAVSEMTAGYGNIYSDLPQSVQTLMKNYVALAKEIHANPSMKNDTATMGPKVKALIDELKAIPDADREAVGQKLPYTKEILLSTGKYYNDFNTVLDAIVAKANGQDFDQNTLRTKGMELQTYVVTNSDEELKYLNDRIDAYQVPTEIAQDGAVNKVAAKLSKLGSKYATMLFQQPQFNLVLNALVNGGQMQGSLSVDAVDAHTTELQTAVIA